MRRYDDICALLFVFVVLWKVTENSSLFAAFFEERSDWRKIFAPKKELFSLRDDYEYREEYTEEEEEEREKRRRERDRSLLLRKRSV